MTWRMTGRDALDYRTAMTTTLTPGAVHLWYTLSDDIAPPAALDSYLGLLSQEEHARHARFLNERARHEYLITRALCRTVLSGCSTRGFLDRAGLAAGWSGREDGRRVADPVEESGPGDLPGPAFRQVQGDTSR